MTLTSTVPFTKSGSVKKWIGKCLTGDAVAQIEQTAQSMQR